MTWRKKGGEKVHGVCSTETHGSSGSPKRAGPAAGDTGWKPFLLEVTGMDSYASRKRKAITSLAWRSLCLSSAEEPALLGGTKCRGWPLWLVRADSTVVGSSSHTRRLGRGASFRAAVTGCAVTTSSVLPLRHRDSVCGATSVMHYRQTLERPPTAMEQPVERQHGERRRGGYLIYRGVIMSYCVSKATPQSCRTLELARNPYPEIGRWVSNRGLIIPK